MTSHSDTAKPITTASKAPYHHGDLRRVLLAAAEAELTEKGVEAFSLRGVAKRAGVSHAAPAYHFSDAPGLLTELAAQGYERFIDMQLRRKKNARKNARAQLAASGLAYIDFAVANPALFRLMFASDRPDKSAEVLVKAADLAFDALVEDIRRITVRNPYDDPLAMTDVLAAWAVAHGLADLMVAGRFNRAAYFSGLAPDEREAMFTDIILRSIGPASS